MAHPTGLDRINLHDGTVSQWADALGSKSLVTFRPRSFLKKIGANLFYFLCSERREGRLEVRARMFFYGGEDPATGSAAGCAASWMVQHGVAKHDEHVVIQQGAECRRPSEMHVRATREAERVTNVRVGGYAVEILRGTVVL